MNSTTKCCHFIIYLRIFDKFLWNNKKNLLTFKTKRQTLRFEGRTRKTLRVGYRKRESKFFRLPLAVLDLHRYDVSKRELFWCSTAWPNILNLHPAFILRNYILHPGCRENLFSTKIRKLKLPWNIPFFMEDDYLLPNNAFGIINFPFNQCTL